MKNSLINETNIKRSLRKRLMEYTEEEEPKQRCLTTNVISLDDIVGPPKDYRTYTTDLYKRNGGIAGMVDTLDILRTLRLHPTIEDGGTHLAYDLMNHINSFRQKNYLDETNNECISAMDKVIELYKENEHGEELVKDIEKVLSHKNTVPRAKEYLKRCLNLIREK